MSKLVLQANWYAQRLHVWGVIDGGPTPAFLPTDELRQVVGDGWDTLLAAAAGVNELPLHLPGSAHGPTLVPVLVLAPAEAIDLLTSGPVKLRGGTGSCGDSLRFWCRAAKLVRFLLAAQRFAPTIHHQGGDRYAGLWLAVIQDETAAGYFSRLAQTMPGVCRATSATDRAGDSIEILESFVRECVDAAVRRCLKGDDLAHALLERDPEDAPPSVRFLRSLVSPNATIFGAPADCAFLYQTVRGWVGKLTPARPERSSTTCFRLDAPSADATEADDGWRMTIFLRSLTGPARLVRAAELQPTHGAQPALFARPFDDGLESVRADIARAARHFPPLSPLAAPDGPLECTWTLTEAYNFLRDAAPVLAAEGFAVLAPSWWTPQRPRPRMRMTIRPAAEGASASGSSAMRLDALVDYDWRIALGDEEMSPEEMDRLVAAKEPLVRLRGQWTEVQPSEWQTAARFLAQKGNGRITLLEALRQCYVADDLDTGLPVDRLRGQDWIDTFLNATSAQARIESLEPPSGFQGSLRPYQLRGLEWLNFLARLGLGGCLADDMGLGKTIQMIALLLHERREGSSPGPTLLVVPMSLVGNWRREIERFAPSLRALVHHGLERRTGKDFVDEASRRDVVISTYALTHRDFEHLSAVEWHRVALDEAQNIKNPAAKQSTAVRALPSAHRLALTGTPVENRLSELWSIMDFLNPGLLGSATDFRRRFAVPVERYQDSEPALRLRNLIRPFVLRRLKSDRQIQLDLPEKMEMRVFCNLTREQAALYQAVVGSMMGRIEGATGMQRRGLILATLIKLKQICDHPTLYLGDESELAGRSGKCERLTEMLDEALAEGDRALVFTQYREMGELLKKRIESAFGREVPFLHGGTTRTQRDAMVEHFQERDSPDRVFLLSLKAGGFGLNLTAANHVFHFDRWWNPAVEDQATDRAHRIGQERRVQVHKFVCVGTLEERIDAMLEQKRHLADRVVGSGEEWLTELSTDALRELVTLSTEAIAED